MTALVEYLIRVRFEEPAGRPGVHPDNAIGNAMHDILGEIEDLAVEQEIVSRTVLAGPDTPSRVRCAARSLDPTRHFATSQRWQITTPDDETVMLCSAACALSWLCRKLPANVRATTENSDGSESEAAA
jgi:hypothetical protein